MSDTVTCCICNKQFKRITHKHLKHHNTTLDEYVRVYPNAPTISDALREKFASNNESVWIEKHGDEEGRLLYANYKKMLAEKNTFAHKHSKYGWSQDQFNAYNATRATTLDNMIKRYGENEGHKRWDEYRAKQAIAGVSESWFITKHGEAKGRQIWADVCRAKRHTLPNYINRYGVDEGTRRYNEWLTKLCNRGYNGSKPELELAELVTRICEQDVVYSHLTHQYCKWSHVLNRAVMYDIVIPSKRIVIEFNGDYWHCNPDIYSASFVHPVRNKTAEAIWKEDQDKLDVMISQGYTTITIWESDWYNHRADMVLRITECLM